MNWRKHFLEAATLIVAGVVCALVANAVASRERKLVVVSQASGHPVAPVVRPAAAPPKAAAPPQIQPVAAPLPVPTQPTTDNRQPTTKKTPDNLTTRQPDNQFLPHPDKAYIEIQGDA